MRRLGLALSGGGFRATLYHLGVVRFLKDAGLLNDVTNIVSVSGGSILAAHLALNWRRYSGSDQDFAEAASEVIEFVRFDLRNHIVRRMPIQLPLRLIRALTLGRSPLVTPTTLLEHYYQRFLYGEACLHELPKKPELTILATNVSEGGMSAFNRHGLFIQRRRQGSRTFEFVPGQMARITKVVSASSAFPGFFSPVEMTAEDLGVRDGTFPTEAFTDGGVYDNLGIRAFSWLKEVHAQQNTIVAMEDFTEFGTACSVLGKALREHDDSAMSWIAEHLTQDTKHFLTATSELPSDEDAECLVSELSGLLRRRTLYQLEEFSDVIPSSQEAAKLFSELRLRDKPMESGRHAWLNRHLMASAFEKAAGAPVLHTNDPDVDHVLVSDAGKPFQILGATSLGMLAQSVRASDILWDRVWQLEKENFGARPCYVFIPITGTVALKDDPTALHPTVQAEVQTIRTDLDRFSILEIRSLVQHGYQIARHVCRHEAAELGAAAPLCPPWNPLPDSSVDETEDTKLAERTTQPARSRTPLAFSREARELRGSAQRRTWSTLFDLRDWTTYVYSLLFLALLFVPFQVYKLYQRAQTQATVIEAIASGDPDFRKILEIVDSDPTAGWQAAKIQKEALPANADYSGLEVMTHTRVIDLRKWRPDGPSPTQRGTVYICELITLRKQESYAGDNTLVLKYPFPNDRIEVSCPEHRPVPTMRQIEEPIVFAGEKRTLFEAEYDLSTVPVQEVIDLELEFVGHSLPARFDRARFQTELKTDVISVWLLFPRDRPYKTYSLVVYPSDGRQPPQVVDTRYTIDHPFGSLIGWSVVNPERNSIYDCRWTTDR